MRPIWLRHPSYQPIKLSSTDYLGAFATFWAKIKIVGKLDLFDFGTTFSHMTAQSCTGSRDTVLLKN